MVRQAAGRGYFSAGSYYSSGCRTRCSRAGQARSALPFAGGGDDRRHRLPTDAMLSKRGGTDILVHPEHVGRVVAPLRLGQSAIAGPVDAFHPRYLVFRHEVDIGGAE